MIEQHQRICIWAGLAFIPLFFAGLLVAGFIPPPTPSLDAGGIAALYAANRTPIRIGIWIATAAAPFLAFYVAALSHLIRRIAGGSSPLMTAQTVAGTCLILEFIFPQMVWQACAYRDLRSPEILLALNDTAWLCYVGVVGTAIAQMLIVAITILLDRRPDPLVPRWLAFLGFWCAAGVSGGSFCMFAKTGPIAWNGLIAWWLLVVSFFIWMTSLSHQMLRVSRLPQDRIAV